MRHILAELAMSSLQRNAIAVTATRLAARRPLDNLPAMLGDEVLDNDSLLPCNAQDTNVELKHRGPREAR